MRLLGTVVMCIMVNLLWFASPRFAGSIPTAVRQFFSLAGTRYTQSKISKKSEFKNKQKI